MAKIEKEVTVEGSGEGKAVDDNNNSDQKNDSNNSVNKSQLEGSSSNNNKTAGTSGAKYQLRPRSLHPRRRCDSEWSLQDTLRHKSRPPPLSRYRRKTANARERYRMRQINTAFESLRGVLPSWVCSRRTASDMTKITTLRLASAYIRSLQDILDGNAPEDTCSWVLSSILQNASEFQEPEQSDILPNSPAKIQQSFTHTPSDTDFVSFLYASSDNDVFHNTHDTLSYLSPMSETEAVALLLSTDHQPKSWSEGHQSPLVT